MDNGQERDQVGTRNGKGGAGKEFHDEIRLCGIALCHVNHDFTINIIMLSPQ